MNHIYPIFSRTGKNPRKFKAGFMNAQGQMVIPFRFEDAAEFRDEHAPVQLNGCWGVMDRQGKLLFPCEWKYPTRFVDGIAMVRVKHGSNPERRGYLKLDGTWIVEPRYILASNFSCGMAKVFNGEFHGFVNQKGEEQIPAVFRDAKSFSENLAPVLLDDKWGYIDPQGTSIIYPVFDEAMPFSEGLARVRLKDRWGFINREGEFVISPEFAMVLDMHCGRSAVSFGDESPYGFIDCEGNLVIAPRYEYVSNFQERFASVRCVRSSERVFINLDGEQAFPLSFLSADSFYMQRALVGTEKICAYIDPHGNTVWEGPWVDRLAATFYA